MATTKLPLLREKNRDDPGSEGTRVTLMHGVDRFEEIRYSKVDVMKKGQDNVAKHLFTNVAITFDLVHDASHHDTDFIVPFYFASARTTKERDALRPDIRFTTYIAFLNFDAAPFDGDPSYAEPL